MFSYFFIQKRKKSPLEKASNRLASVFPSDRKKREREREGDSFPTRRTSEKSIWQASNSAVTYNQPSVFIFLPIGGGHLLQKRFEFTSNDRVGIRFTDGGTFPPTFFFFFPSPLIHPFHFFSSNEKISYLVASLSKQKSTLP